MPSGIRTVQILLGGLCVALGIVVAMEMFFPIIRDVTASPSDQRPAAADPVPQHTVDPATLDRTVNEILQRPLFSADRRPPAPKQVAEDEQAAPTPPPLPDRLDGVMLGPDGHDEALFGNPGEKATAVPVGGTISGWTVKTIGLDQVVLTSAFGDHVIVPTPGERTDFRDHPQPTRPRAPPVRRAAAPTAPPARVPLPVVPQRLAIPAPANRRLTPHP